LSLFVKPAEVNMEIGAGFFKKTIVKIADFSIHITINGGITPKSQEKNFVKTHDEYEVLQAHPCPSYTRGTGTGLSAAIFFAALSCREKGFPLQSLALSEATDLLNKPKGHLRL
jgi:hydroxymethylpyrimidine/phosphomethylpyrimidine kinase